MTGFADEGTTELRFFAQVEDLAEEVHAESYLIKRNGTLRVSSVTGTPTVSFPDLPGGLVLDGTATYDDEADELRVTVEVTSANPRHLFNFKAKVASTTQGDLDEDGLHLQVITQGIFAIHTGPWATGDALSTIGNAIGAHVVAIDLGGAIPELFGDLLTQLQILGPHTGA